MYVWYNMRRIVKSGRLGGNSDIYTKTPTTTPTPPNSTPVDAALCINTHYRSGIISYRLCHTGVLYCMYRVHDSF